MCHISSWPFTDGPIHAKTGKQWLHMKVFCMRLNASGFSEGVQIPESLALHFLPRSSPAPLEINGRRFHPSSSAFLTLQRNRIEEKSEGAITYVGTIRTSDNLCFEVYLRDEPLLFGALEKRQEIMEDLTPETTWTVEGSSRLEYSLKRSFDARSMPTVDIFVTGGISGFKINLTQTLQLLPRKKRFRHGTLDVIPEGNETAGSCSDLSDTELESDYSERGYSESSSGCDCDCDCDWECRIEEVEEQEDSWIETGVTFGIGIGLEMCIWVGLLVSRTPKIGI